jgi:hypothetical protein
VGVLWVSRGLKVLVGIKEVSSKNMGFFSWKDVLGEGFNKWIFGGIYQYLVKLGVFLNIPRTQVLCHRFTE